MTVTTQEVIECEKKSIMKEKNYANNLSLIDQNFTINTNSYDVTFPIVNFNYRENNSEFASINWKVPKPSAALLFAMLIQAGQISTKFQSEIQFFILYNEEADRCEIFHPKQLISGATVSGWTYDDIPEGKRLLVDVHSHHTMSVDFSSTDDQSDKNLSLFCPHISVVLRSINNIDIRDLSSNISCRVTYNDGNVFLCKKLHYDDIFDFRSFILDMNNLNFITKKTFLSSKTCEFLIDEMDKSSWDLYDDGTYFSTVYKKNKTKTHKKKTSKQKSIIIDPEEKAQEEVLMDNTVGE